MDDICFDCKTDMKNLNNYPEWYWDRGIHDAIILDIQFKELKYDYHSKKPIRNVLIIKLDSNQAMFDDTITSIWFYNTTSSDLNGEYKGWWWILDSISYSPDNKWYLDFQIGSKSTHLKNSESSLIMQKQNMNELVAFTLLRVGFLEN